jgi:23S rRNA (cytidine1920-2'-O)/16S rRNA (cytidine1409-2'-O)-methyltransferase
MEARRQGAILARTWSTTRSTAREVRRRLDVEMVRRGLAATRSEAALAIRSGRVVVSGSPAMKAGSLVLTDQPITVQGAPRRYVSRGGEKLEAALDGFGIEVRGLPALDAGASTGGFTDCLLARGAQHVIAVDVGYGQLDWRLREDPRVTVLERVNVRDLDPTTLPYRPRLVTADLSFISLRLALPALVGCASVGARFVLLVKPQFEAGREDVGGRGVVRDPSVWRSVLTGVIEACGSLGLEIVGMMASPLVGPAGNVEFFVDAGVRAGESVKEINDGLASDIETAVRDGLALSPRAARAPTDEGDDDG